MKKIVLLVVVSTLLCLGAAKLQTPAPFTLPTCIQDQFGNQYDSLVVDNQHEVITGTVINNQGCSVDWPMIGSYTVDSIGRVIMEISAANPTPGTCTPMYTLRGPYPTAYWNYTTGFGSQRFVYAACSSRATLPSDSGVGGAHGKP